MRLSELITSRPLTLAFGGGELNIAYNPRAVRLRKDEPDLQDPMNLARLFCEVVADWDLNQDDGTPWPLVPELLFDHELESGLMQEGLPQEVLKAVLDKIGAEVRDPLTVTNSPT